MYFKSVTLSTSKLEALKNFYVDTLGIEMVTENEGEFSLKIGRSELTFVSCSSNHNPFYHFAITISGEHFSQAKKWAQSKVQLNKEDNEDEVYFKFLDAHSFYFEDPAGNVVEFIGRNSMNADQSSFSMKSLLDLSEVNITVEDVLDKGRAMLQEGFSEIFNQPLEPDSLNFLGNRDAYFLLGPVGRTWYFSNQLAESHPVTVELDTGRVVSLDHEGELKIRK
ncbi:hypothetical protein GCM10008967_30030 [Bacillus carboniphilus]|uniref:VOC domain-containing protein n=1 Tax=Bacillus carboniphilus TaxID=86663 RepID=A0ABP3G6L0_9BACI